jgi:hypothetical protein
MEKALWRDIYAVQNMLEIKVDRIRQRFGPPREVVAKYATTK